MKRLLDTDAEIRQVVLQQLGRLAKQNCSSLRHSSYLEMGARMKDRKPAVRRTSAAVLAKLYFSNVSSKLSSLDQLQADGSSLWAEDYHGGPGALERLRFVPSYIIRCWGWPDMEDRALVLQVGGCACDYDVVVHHLKSYPLFITE